MMPDLAIALSGFLGLFALMFIRIPVGVAMIIVGILGFSVVINPYSAINLLRLVPTRTLSDPSLALIPLFVLMGTLATHSGVSTALFTAAHRWFGHMKGGIAVSTVAASAGFGAICGSSVAGAATMTQIALPELRKYGYSDWISTGAIAAGGTLGILVPPSVMLVVYGILTNEDIGQLFIAALIPGVLAVFSQILVIWVLGRIAPENMPSSEPYSWTERFSSLRQVWAVVTVFGVVIGGLYAGWFTATESASIGAVSVLIIGLLRRKLRNREVQNALSEAAKTSANILLILVGAIIFGYFLAVTRTPQSLAEFLTGLAWSPYAILVLILAGYVILGCFLDTLALIVLTVPIVHPIIVSLGFDATWFGILLAVTVGIGLTSPPMGLNLFVIKSVGKDVRILDIYRGVLPFIMVDLLRLAVLVAFPALTLFLPSQM